MDKQQILEKAIQKAIDGGWTPFFVNWYQYQITDDGVVGDETTNETTDFERIIFDKDFAEALWGDGDTDHNGHDMNTITLWAEQVAIKHQNKLISVDPNKREYVVPELPDMNLNSLSDPTALIEVNHVRYQLEKLAGSIPFETHRIKGVKASGVYGPKPAWQHHLQQMVISEDPIKYLEENI